VDSIEGPLGETSQSLGEYLRTLIEMRIVARELPVTAAAGAVGYRYRLADGFLRFWFRFVRPYHDELEAGMSASDLWQAEVEPGMWTTKPLSVLFARSGFTKGLREASITASSARSSTASESLGTEKWLCKANPGGAIDSSGAAGESACGGACPCSQP